MVGGLSVEKSLLNSFGVKTSTESREDDTTASQDLAKMSGSGFFRQSNFNKVSEEEILRMNAWASFAKTGVPKTGKGFDWEKFDSKDRKFLKLDSDKYLSMDKDMLSLEFILGNLRLSPTGTLLEKCLLAEETFFNIGDQMDKEFLEWDNAVCKQFDMYQERKKIETDLITEYGSASVF